MKKTLQGMLAAALLTVGVAQADNHVVLPDPIWRPGLLGDIYRALCEGPLGGSYVNSEPNFLQSWACEGIDWCEVRPETLGCGSRLPSRPTPILPRS